MPIILILLLIPIVLWLPYASFSSPITTIFSLGQAAGLIGAVLFAINFILSTRLQIIDTLFAGINRAYIVHHLNGVAALIFLILHPLLLMYPLGLDIIIPTLDRPAYLFGIAALLILLVLLFITLVLFKRIPYERWQATHKLLGVSFLLGGIHVFLVPSTTMSSLPLRIYMLSIITIGLLAYLYRTMFGKFMIPRTPFFVKSVTALNDTTTEIILRPGLNTLKFIPGQFIFITTLGQTHPFSLTATKGSKELSLAVKALGDYTTDIKKLKPDTQVLVEGPFGRFSYEYCKNPHQIWIAGGIGITPFLSMARSIPQNSELKVHLFYAVKTRSEAVYLDELQKNPHIQLHLHESTKSGYLTAEVLKRAVPDFKKYDIFVCGPTALMHSLRDQCKKLNIPNSRIHDEQFSLQ
ncbi:MAG: ferric reductase-like transmembrane domain-containing protein [Patescibacteria group bacterium]